MSGCAHDQAVTVMTEMERQSRAVDAAIPVFTAPFNPTTGRVEELAPATARAEGTESSGVVGASSSGTQPGGGMMPPGVGRASGEEDTERRTAYVQSEDIFDVPGGELPPSVIGGRKVPRAGDDT